MNANSITAEYKAAVEEIIASGDSTVISNINYAHAVYLTVKQFDKANKAAKIITGKMAETTGDLAIKEAFCKMVRRIAGNNGKVQLITTGYSSRPSWLKDLQKEVGPSLSIIFTKVNPGMPVSHGFVLDEKMYRLEEPHDDEDCQDVHASVCFNDGSVAKGMSEAFDGIWNILQKAA